MACSHSPQAAYALPPGRVSTAQGEAWKIVAHVPLDASALGIGRFLKRHAGLYLGILSLLAVLAYLLASAQVLGDPIGRVVVAAQPPAARAPTSMGTSLSPGFA